MELLQRLFVNFSQLPKCRVSQVSRTALTLRRLPVSQYQVRKGFGSSSMKFKDEEIPSSLYKYEIFPDKMTILDVEEERQKITEEDEVYNEFEGISLERGITGVIDVEEVVALLRREKARDIFVVKIPPQYNYADYKVIVTGTSQRHMLAMATFLRKLYKLRNNAVNIPQVEGKNSKDWMALDLGNIILHIFSNNSRKIYDLETLWSVGKEYDTLTHQQSEAVDNLTDYAKILAELTPKNISEL